MKTMMTLLALACLPFNTHTAHQQQYDGQLPGQLTYPHDALAQMAQQKDMPRQRSVSDIAQNFGGSKGTLRRPGKPEQLFQPTQQHPQPSAPQRPPAYHEWLPLSPHSQDSGRSPSACSNESHSSALERTSSYRADAQPNYVHHFLHEPIASWTSPSAQPSAPALERGIPPIEGEKQLPPDVQQELFKARTEHQALINLETLLAERIAQSVRNCVALSQQTPPPVQKRLGESTAHADSRARKALNDQRQQATAALAALTQAMHKTNKDLTKATTK